MRIVSFFSGCGGLDLGFEQAGFHVIWANELESDYRATYILNHPQTELITGDICNIDPNTIPECDGFIGGPPCQSWSVGGNQKGLDDKRGQLFLKYIDLIKHKHPNFFVIENVKGMLSTKFKKIFEDFLYCLKSLGYDVYWKLLDAINYRIPQNRERVFIIGFKKELNIKFEFPPALSTEPVSLEKAIGDITEVPNLYSGSKQKVIINTLRPNHDVLNNAFGQFYYRGNRRRGWGQPSFTINATADFVPLHPSSPKMMFFGHENWNFQKDLLASYRRLSVRECARIQSFPDSFIFDYTNIKTAYKMVGNAVPPRLAYAVATSIKISLKGGKYVQSNIRTSSVNSNTPVLVGYYKNSCHRNLIFQNSLYYVRSDGRTGSIFRADCTLAPKYLLLYNKNCAEIIRLDGEEPVLVSSSYLKTLGFKPKGELYLCFRLKHDTSEYSTFEGKTKLNDTSYAPYFTTIEELLNNKIISKK